MFNFLTDYCHFNALDSLSIKGKTSVTVRDPAHPGEILRNLLINPLNLPISALADQLDISRKTLSKILNGRSSITPEMAMRLELAFVRPSAEHWLHLQNAYDTSILRTRKETLHVQFFESILK